MTKKIIKRLELAEHKHTEGFSSVGLRSSLDFNTDPFLNMDLFKMSEPTFRPHPHAGFSAVTYMLPESKGTFQNRDSLGDQNLIQPGDIHWTQSGAGMMHEEVPSAPGMDCLGFQIFVNLSRKNKALAPKAFHVDTGAIPEISAKGSKLRVVSGQYKSWSSPLENLATAVTILDLSVEPGGESIIELKRDLNWFLFSISGEAFISENSGIGPHHAVLLSPEGDRLAIRASSQRFRALICGGKPINEPIVWGGPFCMNSKEEVQIANLRFNRGEMGYLKSSF